MTTRAANVPFVLAIALIALWVSILVSMMGSPKGFVTDSRGVPAENDYVGIYTAGRLVLTGEPLAAYDWERHKADQHALLENPRSNHFPWGYPPTFLLVAAALAVLPFAASMSVWIVATAAAFGAALYRISATWRDFLLMVAAPAAWLNIFVGQNGAASAALLGLALVALPSRPVVAGILIGLLSYKPHLGLLIPFALLAGGYGRAFLAAALTVAGIVAVTLIAFGIEPWLALPEQVQRISGSFSQLASIAKLQSVYGFARALGVSTQAALALQLCVAAALAGWVIWLWRRPDIAYELKAAGLAAAITLASPYQFVYDLTILTIAQAFLLRHLATQAIRLTEIAGLVLANVLVFLFAKTAVPLGVIGAGIVLVLVARHVGAETQATPVPA